MSAMARGAALANRKIRRNSALARGSVSRRIQPNMRLKDKNILITGSATGIGAAMARRFVAEGARVVVHGLDRDAGEAVAKSLGDKAVLHICDLADPKAAKELVDFAIA